MKWGLGSLGSMIASAILYMLYQTQSADIFAAGADASGFDINMTNGTGIGAAATLVGGLWAAWRSGSPQRMIRSVGLLAVWSTSLGNKAIADHCNEIAAIAAKADAEKPLPPNTDELAKRLEQSLFDKLKSVLPAFSVEAPKS